jgi:general secretion pathway protein K
MRPRRDTERGAALLVVMVSVAVLTALAVDLAYESRVSLRIAANGRDELRAAQLARGGIAMSRLVLSLQQLVDESTPAVPGAGIPRLQVWRMVPVGPELAKGLFGEAGAAASDARRASDAGTFKVQLDSEDLKVNAQLEGFLQTGRLGAQVRELYQLVCDAQWDPMFDREDANGVRTSREDLLIHLRDWVDEDEVSSALVAAFGATGCATVPANVPFETAFGDENQPYERGDDRYRAKNARMDSVDELFLVGGVGDAFMATFGDRVTVYLPRDAKRNVNETDRQRLVELAKLIADPPGQPMLLDPAFAERLQVLVVELTLGGIVSMSPTQFGQVVQAAGLAVNANLLGATNPNNPFTDRFSTFRIRSTGTAGDVEKAIDAVVRLEKPQPGEAVAAPGRLVYWREE